MKKFDIKWLLILVLVIVLAFGLVACGSKKGNDTPEEEEEEQQIDPNGSTAAEFFNTLWTASKSLGAETVNPNTDKVHIGAEMDISLTSSNVAELDVGVKFGLVADLASMNKTSSADLGDTALMLQAFDKVTGDNWITLWYFLKDKDNIYLSVQNENFKVNFDAYWNEEFSTLLEGVLTTKYDFLHADNILSLINGIAKTGGSNWTLDSLILGDKSVGFDGLLAAFGLDLGALLESLPDGLLGKNTNTNSLGSILESMGGVVVDSASCKKYTNADGSKTYVANKLSSTATTLLNGFTDKLFNSISALSLTYNVKANGAIDDLIIAIKGKSDLANTEIKISITDLTIEKVTGEATTVLGKKSSYDSYANLHFSGAMNASAWGIVINPNDYPISIGNVTLDIDACLDLTGVKANNKTVAGLTLKNDNVLVLKAVYRDNTLTLQTNFANDNNKNIALAALKPLAELIQKASVGADAIVAYKIFGDLAADILKDDGTGMFTYNTSGVVNGVNADYDTIAVTGVDIAVLAKGAFYAIFSDFATGADKEKPAAAAELETYKGDTYIYDGKEYDKNQYAWSLNIKETVAAVLNAVKYAGNADQKDKDYSIELSKLYATLKKVFKKATVESLGENKTKLEVAAPTSVDDMMALFMCTNDGLLLDMTKHGLLPLYKNGITTKYITSTYTPAMAAAEGYYAISGKMISKDNAKAIWSFLTSSSATPQLTLSKIAVGEYFNPETTKEPEKNTIKGYVDNTAIAWFVDFMAGTTLLPAADMTPANIITALTNDQSAIKIGLNRKTGYMNCEITLAGKKLTGTAEYRFFGSNDNTTALAAVGALATGADYTVALDDNFYALFKAAFGMGPTTTLANGHGINTDLYYVASAVNYDATNKAYTSITYTKGAVILVDATHCYVLDEDGVYSALSTYEIAGTTLTVGTETYTIYGNSYKVVVKNA